MEKEQSCTGATKLTGEELARYRLRKPGGIERKTDLYAENACEVPQVGEYDKCTV